VFLSDRDILAELQTGGITCTPFNRENLSNSSLDLRLGERIIQLLPQDERSLHGFLCDENGRLTVQSIAVEKREHNLKHRAFILEPGDFVLGHTLEIVGQNSSKIISEVADKSTLARLGISTFFGAGYIDAGNVLSITLEIKNNGHVPVALKYGMHIAQLRFAYLTSDCMMPYEGKYKNSTSVDTAV